MKIHYGRHKIVKVDKNEKEKHIPLAYMGSPTNNEIHVKLNTISPYNNNNIEEIRPYDIIDGFDTIIFNEDMTISDNNKILRKIGNDKYFYIPNIDKKEKPTIFGYQVLYKSNKRYSQLLDYNIKVGFVDNTKGATKSKELISIFGDSNTRGVSANNVIVNNGDMSPASLINREMKDNDILFIETDDGEHYKGTKVKIDYEQFKKDKTNIWLIAGKNFNCEYGEIIPQEDSKAELKTNIFFNDLKYKSDFVFQLYKNNIKEIHGDSSLIVTQNLNDNFVVITGEDFFKNLSINAKAIHEILLYVFLNRYIISNQKYSWVHNFLPDYKIKDGKLIKINEFYEDLIEKEDCIPIKTIHNKNFIESEIKEDKIVFKYNHPNYKKKKQGDITVCNDNLEIIFINNKDKRYLVNKELTIESYKYKYDTLEIKFSPIVNSKKSINITKPYIHKEYIDIRSIQEKNLFININNNNFKISHEPSDSTIGVVNINIKNDYNTEVYDIRIKGGGQSKKQKDNYNLLDIGSSYGRPMRKSGSMIITLPEKARPYKDKIMKYINDNKIADRHVILLFQERR